MLRMKLRLNGDRFPITGDYIAPSVPPAAVDFPLVVAIHGGSYTNKYFDIEGHSLVERSAALGIPIFALNRPCYAESGTFALDQASIPNNTRVINDALHQLWDTRRGPARGIFIIGHSIGAAITILIAAMEKKWPLLGIAVSGVGMTCPQHLLEKFRKLPPDSMTNFDVATKDAVMFGPASTFIPGVPGLCHSADAEIPTRELLDINFEWPRLLGEAAPLVRVPIHYRQAEFDRLWNVDEGEVIAFKQCFTHSPLIDAELFRSAGHCIDFHRPSCAFQLQQLAFALKCSIPV